MYTDKEIFDWLENNEHKLEGDLFSGYTLTTTWHTTWGSSIREAVQMMLDMERR